MPDAGEAPWADGGLGKVLQRRSAAVIISEASRKRFEDIGLELIKRELAVGNSYCIRSLDESAEAQEWVAEQEREKWWPWIKANVGTPAAIISAVAGTIALIVLLINTSALHKRWTEEDEAKKPRVRLQSSGNLIAGQFRELSIGLEPQPPEAAWIKSIEMVEPAGSTVALINGKPVARLELKPNELSWIHSQPILLFHTPLTPTSDQNAKFKVHVVIHVEAATAYDLDKTLSAFVPENAFNGSRQ
jgi:hypothetical protein